MLIKLPVATLYRILFTLLGCAGLPLLASAEQASIQQGKSVYDYYCYQCHGYAGNAKTLAAAYLTPAPRDFTQHTPKTLPADKIREAIQQGRPGTAMVAFSSVLDEQEIESVILYISNTFMAETPPDYRYHTKENGWPDHARYQSAFAFVNGEISATTPDDQLTPEQQTGRNLFLNACVSCHDHTLTAEQPVWEPQPVSYPRNPGIDVTYKSTPDITSAASPYAVHDRLPVIKGLSKIEKQGQALFQSNCAFCHAADGTGRNWIGSFMQPPARDLTRSEIIRHGKTDAILHVIDYGLPNTSMPAWRDVLTPQQKTAIVSYIMKAFGSANTK
jgi:cytochrome c oxidase cbb3-type subunit 3